MSRLHADGDRSDPQQERNATSEPPLSEGESGSGKHKAAEAMMNIFKKSSII